jgi:hypothetical protein
VSARGEKREKGGEKKLISAHGREEEKKGERGKEGQQDRIPKKSIDNVARVLRY